MSTADRLRAEGHTPEPWTVNNDKNYLNGAPLMLWGPRGPGYGSPASTDSEENAIRIVACVNMLAGIPTADLLRQPPVGATARPIGELVDAATEAANLLESDVQDAVPATLMVARLRAAIAALKGTVQS